MKCPIISLNSNHGAAKPTCICHVLDYLVVFNEDNRLQIEKVDLKMIIGFMKMKTYIILSITD